MQFLLSFDINTLAGLAGGVLIDCCVLLLLLICCVTELLCHANCIHL